MRARSSILFGLRVSGAVLFGLIGWRLSDLVSPALLPASLNNNTLIQTGLALLASLIGGGYHALANALLAERRSAQLPPYGQLALLRADAVEIEKLKAFIDAAIATAGTSENAADVMVHPMTAPMPRRAGAHRAQILVEAADRSKLHAFLPPWLNAVRTLPQARKLRWSIDVDPIDML